MRKLTLLLFAILFALQTNAQTFTLTPNGLMDSDNTDKNYIILSFNGKTQDQLFNDVLISIGKTFISPNDVISKVEGKQITINGVFKNAVFRTKHHHFDLHFTMVLEFKDSKIKVNSPSINEISKLSYSSGTQYMFVSNSLAGYNKMNGEAFSIYDHKKGTVKIDMAKETLEMAVNILVDALTKSINDDVNNDW